MRAGIIAGMHRNLFSLSLAWLACAAASATTLDLKPAPERCGAAAAITQAAPAAAASRIPDSQAVSGSRDIAWVWLGSPTNRYAHDALGSGVHATSLHAIVAQPDGSQRTLSLALPADRVFEDRVPRLADLDGDGRDEIVLVESDLRLGSSVVVYGVRPGAGAKQPVLAELARGAPTGTPQNWLNPAGIADFDGDGRPDIAAVLTPHVRGVLTLYRYRPPVLELAAQRLGISNHRVGTAEQQLSAIVTTPGQRPALIVPGAGLRSLHVVRVGGGKQWQGQLTPAFLPAQVQRITALPGGACVLLTNGSTLQATLHD
jgi:hypothetical protein